MRKIAIVLNNWGTYGGAATYHRALTESLIEQGMDVSVCIPFKNEKWEIPKLPFKLFYGECAVKECQKSTTWIVWAMGEKLRYLLGRKKTRPKVVVINHGDGNSDLSLRCLKVESKFADEIVVVSRSGLDAVPSPYRSKTTVIYPFINKNRLQPSKEPGEVRELAGLSDDDKVLLFLGRICEGKRLDVAFETVKLLPCQWKLVVAGAESSTISIKGLFGNHRVRFCGPTLFPGDYLQIADCVISPSVSEGFGLSVMEAAISGIPIIACETGILAEIKAGTVLAKTATAKEFAIAASNSSKTEAIDKAKILEEVFSRERFSKNWSNLCDT